MGHLGDGATGPSGNRYGDAAGHSCMAVSGPVDAVITLETGSAEPASQHARVRAPRALNSSGDAREGTLTALLRWLGLGAHKHRFAPGRGIERHQQRQQQRRRRDAGAEPEDYRIVDRADQPEADGNRDAAMWLMVNATDAVAAMSAGSPIFWK